MRVREQENPLVAARTQVSFTEKGLVFMERTRAPIMPMPIRGRASFAVLMSSLSLMALYLLLVFLVEFQDVRRVFAGGFAAVVARRDFSNE